MELDPKFPLPKELMKTLTQHSQDIVLSSTHFLFLYILRSLCSKASSSLNNYRVILVCICAMVQSEVLKNQADHELCFPLMCSAKGELQFDPGIATQPSAPSLSIISSFHQYSLSATICQALLGRKQCTKNTRCPSF